MKDLKMSEDNTQQKTSDMPLTVHAQYIKDLSFENPNAPQSLKSKQGEAPKMEVNVNLDSVPLEQKGQFEVTLTVNMSAKREGTTLFIAELVYGVVVSLSDLVTEEHVHPLLMIEVPKMAFPFARQILCDAVIGGGYPPLLLNPVDFEGLYIAQYKAQKNKA
jgi:preprotein translocase subunit SecB